MSAHARVFFTGTQFMEAARRRGWLRSTAPRFIEGTGLDW